MHILQPILDKLATKIPVDRIFEFEYPFIDTTARRLLIVVGAKCQVAVKTLEPMAELCLAEAPEHSFDLIPYGELKTALNNGSLYYLLACREPHLRLLSGKKPLPILSRKQLESVRTKAQEHYEKGRVKQLDFLDGMHFYREKGNHAQALFMLHQAAELTFRGIENAVFKRDRPSHGLQEHLRLMGKYIPEFAELFPKGEPHYFRLLKLIDQSYTAVRYQRNFDVEPEELDQLYQKLIPLLEWCNRYYDQCMRALELLINKAVDPAPVEPVITPDDSPHAIKITLPEPLSAELAIEQAKAFNTILTGVAKREALDYLILLGHEISQTKKLIRYTSDQPASAKMGHCYVLGIGSGSTSKSHTIVHPLIRVTVLLCAAQHTKHALEKKNHFFIQALSKGTTLYVHEGLQPLSVPEPDWSLALEKSRAAWKYRKYKADTYLQCAQLARNQRKDIGAATMLVAQSLEQLCIGLIYAGIGYRVDQCNIPFLLQVCNLISPELAECFVTGRDADKDALKALANSLNAVRYKKEDAPTDTDLTTAIANYDRFRTHAAQVCESVFEYLDGLVASTSSNVVQEARPAEAAKTEIRSEETPGH
ncbi:hypothetical protein GCM10007415_12200 [Parapedobacter pyrenivorans]|uniref:HEPN domain-containing protein n=1 Tax=Parapedobacter pyrenivorans TaxID=1305674 RepID=A0A917HJH7_9SPHI|nr:HEPN domain-containing protein [Parapedobacter pyrenivorans]GGG81174.1 hypothetical protein GCM10007415_12200 [Parapedobacter pyrenivorans]